MKDVVKPLANLCKNPFLIKSPMIFVANYQSSIGQPNALVKEIGKEDGDVNGSAQRV
jgi:hypothetical protein